MVLVCPKGCEKTFDGNANLRKHLDQKIPCDSELRRYPCHNEGCKHKSVSRQNRRTHMQTCKVGKLDAEPQTIDEWRKANEDLSKRIASLLSNQNSVTHAQKPIASLSELEPESASVHNEKQDIININSVSIAFSAESRLLVRSVTDRVDRRSGQFYFTLPPGSWTEIRKIGEKTNLVLSELFLVIKIGYNGENTGRHNKHDAEFGGTSRILDSLVSPVAAAAELKIKDRLINDGKLFSGKHANKKIRDNELIIITSQTEYEEYVALAQKTIKDIESSITSADICMYNEWKQKVHMLREMFSETQSLLTQAEQVTNDFEDKLNVLDSNTNA